MWYSYFIVFIKFPADLDGDTFFNWFYNEMDYNYNYILVTDGIVVHRNMQSLFERIVQSATRYVRGQ